MPAYSVTVMRRRAKNDAAPANNYAKKRGRKPLQKENCSKGRSYLKPPLVRTT